MKILHVINNLGSGGAEKLLQQLLPLMHEQEDVEVDLLLLTDKNNVFEDAIKSKGVNIHVLSWLKPRNPLNVFAIRNYIIKGNYDIIHAHLFPTLYWVSLASRCMPNKSRPKLVFTEHSTYNRRRGKKFFKYIDKLMYSSYDSVISISREVQKNLVTWLGVQEEKKFVTIPNGIHVETFQSAKAYALSEINPQFSKHTKLIGMVGRFSEAKDQKTLIRCMQLLPENIHLLLVGDGPLKAKCEEFVRDLGVEQRVHFLGFRNDVARILKTCDIIVLSSHWEGFGLAAVEGMATGKPVIASDVPGLSEVVGDAGILFERRDYRKLAKHIERLMNDVEEFHKIAKACYERSLSFDISNAVDEHLRVYDFLARSRN